MGHRAIIIDTLRQRVATRHGVRVWCRRWEEIDLAALCERGYADRPLASVRFRCRDCGCVGQAYRQAPVPAFVPNDPAFGRRDARSVTEGVT